MQKKCLGVEWWGRSPFRTAHQHSGQRLPTGIPLQIMILLCIAQLCSPTLSALPHTNCGPIWELRYCEPFQAHYRTTWNSSACVPFKEVSPCLWKNNTHWAAALLQNYRDDRVKVHTVLGPSAPLVTVAPLIHVCPLVALFSSYGTLRKIYDWWRVRLKPGRFVADVLLRCNTLM